MSGCVPVCITNREFSASETLCTHAHLIVCHAWNWKHCNPQMTLKNGCAAPQRLNVLRGWQTRWAEQALAKGASCCPVDRGLASPPAALPSTMYSVSARTRPRTCERPQKEQRVSARCSLVLLSKLFLANHHLPMGDLHASGTEVLVQAQCVRVILSP